MFNCVALQYMYRDKTKRTEKQKIKTNASVVSSINFNKTNNVIYSTLLVKLFFKCRV